MFNYEFYGAWIVPRQVAQPGDQEISDARRPFRIARRLQYIEAQTARFQGGAAKLDARKSLERTVCCPRENRKSRANDILAAISRCGVAGRPKRRDTGPSV
jgi:hypothetical protein